MHPITLLITLLLSASESFSTPLIQPTSTDPLPCGQTNPECPSPLTCIPLSTNCTHWATRSSPSSCPGRCELLDLSQQQIYTLCGGWALMDDCDERIERCVADPRRLDSCGPSCDGPGICWPFKDICDAEGKGCGEGKVCFWDRPLFDRPVGKQGKCLPLRFGSDYYEKTRLEEVTRTDQDGWQRGD
ncbi:hypothetical protein V8F33_007958 [Rhypophila sp. PSN 637]